MGLLKSDHIKRLSLFWCFFCRYFFAIKLQSLNVTREKLRKALLYEKCSRKVLMKLTPEEIPRPQIWQPHTLGCYCGIVSTIQPLSTRSRSYQTFFSPFFFFSVKLGHFTINIFFCMWQKCKLTSEKRKNSSLAKKKSMVGSTPDIPKTIKKRERT